MIHCLIRKKKVAATPEEKVRQGCLFWMIDKLGYPPSQIVVESSLKELPHLQGKDLIIPDRRVDILVYKKENPLLLIECKADKILDKSLGQLLGYRHWIEAPYFALVGKSEVKTYYIDNQEVVTSPGLPYWISL